EDVGDLLGRGGEPALGAPRRHGSNEDPGIEADGLHPDPVAEQRAARKRAGGIDGDDTDLEAALAIGTHELFREGTLARPGRSRDAIALRVAFPDLAIQLGQ